MQDQIITHRLSELVGTSPMVFNKMNGEQSYIEIHQRDNWSRKKDMNQDGIWTHSRVNCTPRRELVLLDNS